MTATLTLDAARKKPRFNDLSLSSQFAITGGAIMLLAMTLAGYFTAAIVSKATVENTAGSTALFMDSFISPLVQKLATDDALQPDNARRLDDLLGGESFKRRFPHLEIWKQGGQIAYSTTPALIGRRFPRPPGLLAALSGKVSAQYADLRAREHVLRSFDTSYLEIYVPIREDLSGRVIAVAEIHETTEPLEREISEVRLYSWLAIASSTLLIMLSLFAIVYRGSRVIEAQRAELRDRIVQIQRVSSQNLTLRQKAQRASSRITEMTEAYLRRIGAELHDGPAQLIGFAALKVEHVRSARTADNRDMELRAIDTALADAIRDIRHISKGLMLPEIEALLLPEVIDHVVRTHERRTGSEVQLRIGVVPSVVPPAIKICAYRFLQEGLNNAFRHAGSGPATVSCDLVDCTLVLCVRDQGGPNTLAPGAGLGLIGLRERAESLGGSFHIATNRSGSTIEIHLPIIMGEQDG
jgi:signal transduction histidine kinase